MKVDRKRVPDIDYSLFKWLKKGDQIRIASETRKSESMVSAVINGASFNPDIIEVAMKIVVERMEPILTYQKQAQQLREHINNAS